MGKTSERIDVLALKRSRNTKKFCVKRPNPHQKHSAGIDCPLEGNPLAPYGKGGRRRAPRAFFVRTMPQT